MTPMTKSCVIALASLTTACGEPGAGSVHPVAELSDAPVLRPGGEPRIELLSQDATSATAAKYDQGYAVVGAAEYLSPGASASTGAAEDAKRPGAELVLISQVERRVESVPVADHAGVGIPLSEPRVPATGLALQSSFVVRQNVPVYEQVALFLAPLGRSGSGVLLGEGDRVIGVRTASPAARADIRVGDILVAVNGQTVATPTAAVANLEAAKGKSVELALFREGTPVTKRLTIPEREW